MAQIDIVPLVLKDVTLALGADSYEKHVDEVTFTPSASPITWTGLGQNSYTDVPTATWGCGLKYAQDWETEDSLSQYLLEHEGETVAAVFMPRSDSGPSFTATLTITPGAIGGTVNAYSTASVTLGSTKPVLVPSAAAIPLLVSALPSGAAEGELVTIEGYRLADATDVDFGAVAAQTFTPVAGALVVVMPAGSAGAVNLVVTNTTGASAALSYTRGA